MLGEYIFSHSPVTQKYLTLCFLDFVVGKTFTLNWEALPNSPFPPAASRAHRWDLEKWKKSTEADITSYSAWRLHSNIRHKYCGADSDHKIVKYLYIFGSTGYMDYSNINIPKNNSFLCQYVNNVGNVWGKDQTSKVCLCQCHHSFFWGLEELCSLKRVCRVSRKEIRLNVKDYRKDHSRYDGPESAPKS